MKADQAGRRTVNRGRLVLAALLLVLPLTSQEPFVLDLRVRLTGSGQVLPDRLKEDFRVFVNGNPKDVLSIRKERRSLGEKTDLGRVFVWSFRVSQIGPPLDNTLAYLASEILEAGDSLYVRTPLSLSRLSVGPNKEGVLRRVREFVNADGRKFGADRASTERRLETYLADVRASLGEDPQSIEAYKKTSMFLNSFTGEFSDYRERFLLPNSGGYRLTLDQIPPGEGERWWIHFEQHESSALFVKIKRTIDSIKGYLHGLSADHQSMSQVLGTKLAGIESAVSLPENFPAARMREALLAHDMNYSVLFFRGVKGSEPDFAGTPFNGLEMLTREVTSSCGGLALSASGAGLDIKALAAHVDESYILALSDDGSAGDRSVRVEFAEGGRGLSYAARLEEKRVRSLAGFQSQAKVGVEGVALEGGRLVFDVKGYSLSDDDKIGLLKVRVRAHDPQGRQVYDQENSLRATKDRVNISLALPPDLRGTYDVAITACDMIANRKAVLQRRVELPGSRPDGGRP